ncbi:uncharacterized protein LOC118391700 [Oncorhynchus keta]|uniref:uncharacterized protein LOC118391700 n=1 Tax=Oncorhynchus keta TaxID=8018 RepID=UPI0015FCE7A7|nr:uncharacterized protein LOC118391700 [Oncorhynchus keta]
MASCITAHKGWFGERGVHQGVGLDILFSGRDFDTTDLYSPNDTKQPQDAKSHYACPRATQRSLHGWGTYSPPPQISSPSTERRGGASSSARPVSLNQCQGYHAHTLPLPRRALAVFRPSVYSSTQGFKTTTVDKPRMLRATIRSRPSNPNQSGRQQSQHQSQDQHQSQPFQHQQQPRPNQQQHQRSLSPKLLYQPILHPKPVYQPSLSPTLPVYRRLTTWQHKDNTNIDSNTIKTNNSSHSNSIKRQVDMTSQNVFSQPGVLASLRGPSSPRQTRKTTNLEEELRRLIIMDNTSEESGRDAYCRHSFSTEISLGSGPMDYSLACSPVSDCSELAGLEDLSASELSLTEVWGSGHNPLPDPAGSLKWSNLVNGAKAYEAQRTVELIPPSKPMKHGSKGGPTACPPNYYLPQDYNFQPVIRSEVPSDLSDRLHHLEVLLRHLESNLEKEKQDRIALMGEVTILRETNQRLWEESISSNEKLSKLSLLFNVAPGMVPRERE